MTAILIPVKRFSDSKRRLSARLPPPARAALAAALCADFFEAVAQVGGARVCVVTAEGLVLERARALGWRVFAETEQISESRSIDAASRLCAQDGIGAVLRLPIDLPLAEPADIESLLQDESPAPSAVLVPSRDGTGTNALLRAPPDLFPSRFGPDSFGLHLDEAKKAGATVRIVRHERLGLDIDDIEDLRAAAPKVRRRSNLAAWLKSYAHLL